MIKRTIEISRDAAHLAVRHDQLLLKRNGELVASIPCEDLGVVVVDHPQSTYTHAALAALMERDAVVIICGANHLPTGILLPLADHNQIVWRVQEQVAATKPVQKQLWKQIVQAKILAQAGNLSPGSASRRKLENLARDVKSGDSQNHEAQAARIYWSAWLFEANDEPSPSAPVSRQADDTASSIPHHFPSIPDDIPERFRRDPDGGGLNALLNYGYAILRAAVSRAIVAAGLHPALGLHHCNRGNPFCLADDLMEPLRPLIDARARSLYRAGHHELDQSTKAQLLELLAEEVTVGQESGPLMVNLHRYISSLVRCYQGTAKRLLTPVIPIADREPSNNPGTVAS